MILTKSLIFILFTKIPMKLIKANSTKARKTRQKQSITYRSSAVIQPLVLGLPEH